MNKNKSWLFLMYCIAVFMIVRLFLCTGESKVTIGEDRAVFSYNEHQTEIMYEDIARIGIVQISDYGSAVEGGLDRYCRWGLWHNSQLGTYTQYTSLNSDVCVLVFMEDGANLLVSYENEDTTARFCNSFCEMLENKGFSPKPLDGDT